MLSKNLHFKKGPAASAKRKKITITLIMAVSVFFIAYGIYTLTRLNNEEGQKAEVKVETGDRPLKQTTIVYVSGTDNGLSLRKDRDTKSQRLAIIPEKTKLEATEELDGWYKVTYNGQTGWVVKKYTTTEAPADDPAKTWSYYTNKAFGYKIKYPLGWKLQDYGANSASKTLSIVAFSPQDLPTEVPANTEFIAPITVEVTAKSLVETNKELGSISGVLIEATKANTYPATKYTYTSPDSNTQMTAMVVSAGGKVYILNEGGGYAEDLIKMANTFTIGG